MHQRIITAPPDCLLIIIYCSPNSCHLFVLSLVSLYLLKILWLNICSVCESIYVYIHIQVIGSEAFIKKKVPFFFSSELCISEGVSMGRNWNSQPVSSHTWAAAKHSVVQRPNLPPPQLPREPRAQQVLFSHSTEGHTWDWQLLSKQVTACIILSEMLNIKTLYRHS